MWNYIIKKIYVFQMNIQMHSLLLDENFGNIFSYYAESSEFEK